MKIDKNHPIFQSESFEKDKEKYYILSVILENPKATLYSDGENYVLGQDTEGYPTWIWTIEGISDPKIEECKEEMREHFLTENTNSFTCKQEVYEKLSSGFNYTDYFEMAVLDCDQVKKVESPVGFMDISDYGDKVTLAKYWVNNCLELYPDKATSFEESLEEAERWIESNRFYVWRDTLGKIVSMASYTTEGTLAKISHVYTPKEERKKGYCTGLVSTMTKKLLDKGYKVMLYTNHNYIASNRAYEKVGYHKIGLMINFKITRNIVDQEIL